MISRKKKTLYYGLLLVMGSILPIAIYAQNAHAYTIFEAEATYRTDYGEGFWAEATLHVTLYIYSGGALSFFYSESHRQSKPWYAIWGGPNNYARLYEESPGVWTAENRRQVWLVWYWAVVIARVHFNENNLNFYYSEFIWQNGHLIIEHAYALYGIIWEFED